MKTGTSYDPLGLPITPAFYEFLAATDVARDVAADTADGVYDEHLVSVVRKIMATEPRGTRQVRRVAGVTIAELDALAPYALRLRGLPGASGLINQGVHWLAGNAACKTIEHLRETLAASDPSQVSEQRYPLHNRLRLRQAEANTVMALLDWLLGPGTRVVLAEPDPTRRGALRPSSVPHTDLMLEFLDIDPARLAEEERAMRAAGTLHETTTPGGTDDAQTG